ncbi:MAG: site-specific DNA-methyltransferase [Deltaproteobacteria bacterium]|nr:site-specific DNA-methyltransferase [Deltaproteobacteria bacterium]
MSPETPPPLVSLHLADSSLLLPTLPDSSFDFVLTDPPYSPGGASPVSRSSPAWAKIQDADARTRYPAFAGDSRDSRSLYSWLLFVLGHCRRVARPNGILLLFSDWRNVPLFSDAVQGAGWVWRSLVVWDKTAKARPNRGFFRHQAEYVLFATRGAWEPPTSAALPGVFTMAASGKNHVASKPVALARALAAVLPAPSDVLDPFMGGGNLLRGALEEGHRVTGIELEPASFREAEILLEGRPAPLRFHRGL